MRLKRFIKTIGGTGRTIVSLIAVVILVLIIILLFRDNI